MYVEKQLFQNRYTRWLKRISTVLICWQLIAFLGAETGLRWLPLGYVAHLILFVVAGTAFVLAHNVGLDLRVSARGWMLRRTPFQLFYRHIDWSEIRSVRILKPFATPSDGRRGRNERSIGQIFILSNPKYDVVCIEMTSGFQVHVSVQKPKELMEFLRNRLLQPDLLKKLH